MKTEAMNVLQLLLERSCTDQKSIAVRTGLSLGSVNNAVKELRAEGYLDGTGYQPSRKALSLRDASRTKNAVILAAGSGLRMLPMDRNIPKGLMEIYGEPMIERLIRQLHEVGIAEIYVVLGYMKESFEYLEDKYQVKLLVRRDYVHYNNLYSLACAADYIGSTYIIPCDIYCRTNPFHAFEFYSWYLFNRAEVIGSELRVKRSGEIVAVGENDVGTQLLGIAYISGDRAELARRRLFELTKDGLNRSKYWEEILMDRKRLLLEARFAQPEQAFEINTYEDLRKMEPNNRQLSSDAVAAIEACFHVSKDEIQEIRPLKVGITNRSILFMVNNIKYIMRIPGEGTELVIDRKQEALVYDLLRGRGVCDDNLYMDPEKGFKITRYLENSRVCDETDPEDIRKCMQKVRSFHSLKLQTEQALDLFGIIRYYEDLFGGKSGYRDYAQTKRHCMAMKRYVEQYSPEPVLCHLDCNPDNFLFSRDEKGAEKIDLIDWEYSMMQVPMADLAGFITYKKHDRAFADLVIDAYYPEGCTAELRLLIYCYIALWGLYGSNWCEYRQRCGVEIGEYALVSYHYAKAYYRIFEEEYRRVFGKEYEIDE